jgi:hypothetical protein
MINVYTYLENTVDSVWSLLNQTTNISSYYENIIIIIFFSYCVLRGLTWSTWGVFGCEIGLASYIRMRGCRLSGTVFQRKRVFGQVA